MAYIVLIAAMMIAPTFPTVWEDARAASTVLHISTLSDGKNEKTVSFPQPGSDRSLALNIPNGARIVSAGMNISGLPLTDGGEDCPENVTVDVGNDGTPEWAFQGKAYGQMGRQTLFSNGAPSIYVGFPWNGGTNSNPAVRLPKNATVTSARMNVSGSGFILIIYADNDPDYANDIATKLKAFKNEIQVVDTFNASLDTPTLDLLLNYSACIVYVLSYTNISGYTTFKDRVALGNVLADYVDAGGGVVTANFCWFGNTGIGGRFKDQGYFGLPTGATEGAASPTMSIDQVQMPDHPIMKGVNKINFTNYAIVAYPFIKSGVNGAQVVFTWSLSFSAAAFVRTMPNGVNRVDLDMPPWSDAVPYRGMGCQGYTGDGDVLMKNSLIWAGGGGRGNFSLDFGNDGGIDWTAPDLNSPETIPDFSSELNSCLAKAQPTGTDGFGNAYVDVPISVSSNASGKLTLGNLNITYRSTSKVGVNPVTGDLAGALNALVPKKYDMKSSNITIAIFSNHAGRIKISDVNIGYTLVHPPIIQTRIPEESTVFMNERETREFIITAWDPCGYPMCVTWLVNNKPFLEDHYNMSWHADYLASGNYTLTALVDNGEQKVTTSWTLIVKNVNRNPVIISFEPEKTMEMDENSSVTFTVTASDPDEDALAYAWYVDGKRVTDLEPTYEYKTTYASAGKHEVKVSVLDTAGASAVMFWNVTVNNVNAAPEITDSTPPGDEVSMNENSTRKFRVTDMSIDGDKHIISWYLDGNDTGAFGDSYQYSADFDSAGRHEIAAQVSDGEFSVRRTWHINVANLNRPPVAVISAPAAGAEFMAGDDIALDGGQSSDIDGDRLSMTWTEGPETLGSGAALTIKLSKGEHTIVLNVNDGQKTGTANAQVQIMARYLDFSGNLRVDNETPVEGRMLKLIAVLTNKGDGSIKELFVSFRVDGTEVSTTTMGGIGPDSIFPLEFHWKAVKGDHKLEVRVNNQNFSKTVTVAEEPAVTAPFGGDMILGIAIAVVAVVAIAAAVAVFGPGRKSAHVQPGGSGLSGAKGGGPVSATRGKGRTGAGPKSTRDGRRGEGRGSHR